MFSRSILTASTLSALWFSASAAPFLQKRAPSFDYGNQKIRGVNLGGWLVLEPWITPSLFPDGSYVDEWGFSAANGGGAEAKLKAHWDSWIGPDDFASIKAAGLNHVRIPVGYWAVKTNPGDPYVSRTQLTYLDKAVGWARDQGIKVLVDLHGAPGSQNGFDNSGHNGSVQWTKQTNSFEQTVAVITELAQRYADDTDTVSSIELLNEPMGVSGAIDMGAINQYYLDGYDGVHGKSSNMATVTHDAFQPFDTWWQGFMKDAQHQNVLLDTHQYQIFSPGEVSRGPSEHVKTACALGPRLASTDKPAFVGEWTGAQTDCAKYLNGRQRGARYDGTFGGNPSFGSCAGKDQGSAAAMSDNDKKSTRSYIEAQLDAYDQGAGWIFWTWKTEGAPGWDMQDLLASGLFPKPLTARQYPGQC